MVVDYSFIVFYAGFCGEKDCGRNGRCHVNDTCVCKKGYFGYLCEKTCKCQCYMFIDVDCLY